MCDFLTDFQRIIQVDNKFRSNFFLFLSKKTTFVPAPQGVNVLFM